MIKCVAVIVEKENKILVGRRTDNCKITSPGGHVEPGETNKNAIIRETKEEFNIDINDIEEIGKIEFDGGVDILFVASNYNGTPIGNANEIYEVGFVTRENLESMDLYEPFRKFLSLYDKYKVKKNNAITPFWSDYERR